MARPTIQDVAKVAGVSLATVDRALNGRGGVAAKSLKKVEDAVASLGYVRDVAAANLSRGRDLRFVFLLPSGQSSFVKGLIAALDDEIVRLRPSRVEIDVRSSKTFDVAAQIAALRRIDPETTDCAAVIVADVPHVRAEIARLTSAGVKVLTLVSDLPQTDRTAYIGPDNMIAGRMAGSFLGRFLPEPTGRVLVIAGSLAARDHAERLIGFQQVMQADHPQLEVLPVVEGFDTPSRVAQIVSQVAAQPLAGIYAIGAGNFGLVGALRLQSSRPVTIAHELTGSTRAGLRDGLVDLVIDQDPARAIHRAVTLMRDLCEDRAVAAGAGNIPLNIFIKENVT